MNIKIMPYKSILATVIMVLALSLPAEAQFLDKLTKGLEKVNKSLDKVDKVLKFDETLKKQNKKSEKGAPSQTGTNQTSSVDVSGWKEVEPTYPTPYISAETKFMVTNPSEYNISDVHDGVFAVKRDFAFEFWKVNGEKLFDAEWKYAGESGFGEKFPTFSNGVAVARRTKPNENGKTPIYLLYLDGRIKELDPSWETVSQFMDGVALVTRKINYYEEQVFYIDIAGNKIYPHLKVVKGRRNPMRPLRDGLRAYCGSVQGDNKGRWGFIDDQGNVKIAPQYGDVSDFSHGYAWVLAYDNNGYSIKELIDVTGKVVLKMDPSTITTEVDENGVYCVEEKNRNVYYNLEGKELASYREANGFYKGYAFIAQGYDHVEVIDRNFNIVNRISHGCSPVDVGTYSPNFYPYGLATVNTGSTVIAPDGKIVLTEYEGGNGTYIRGFRQFAESGYMKATNCDINRERCMAFVKPTGEIAWLFSDVRSFGIDKSPLPEPKISIKTPQPPVVGHFPPNPPVDRYRPPIGPIFTDKVSFTVNVLATPAEGGSVSISPTGKFGYGKYATINASPNKDWAVLSIKTDAESWTDIELGKPFSVLTDQTVTVNFVKKETEEAPNNFGIYQGQINFEGNSIPVYAEINQKGAEKNPYGDENYGFISIMFDPNKRYLDEDGEVAANIFAIPFKIVGIQKDAANMAKHWLVVEGGSFTVHNPVVGPRADPFVSLLLNGMMLLNGVSTISMHPRRYRIEMLDRNPETGEFLFGNLETYSVVAGGWVPGGDQSLERSTGGGFLFSYSENGHEANTFVGARMKNTKKRNDILWYPPESWYKDKESYQQMIKSMESSYRNDKSDYEQLFAR